MKLPRYVKVILAISLWIVVLLMIYARSPLEPWLRLKSLEREVKRNVDPGELQRWATDLLAQHPGETTHSDDYYGKNFYNSTNLPSGFKKIGNYCDGVHVLTGGREPSVAIFDLTKDGPVLVVGSPSLATPTNGTTITWKPGIFFVGQE